VTLVIVEWASTVASFTGTALIAHHVRDGWLLNTIADGGFVVFALAKRMFGFLGLCLGYAVLNLIGYFS
jgi:hypothetical protein